MMDPKNLDRAAKAFKEFERISALGEFPFGDVDQVTVTLRGKKLRATRSVSLSSPDAVKVVTDLVRDARANLVKELKSLGLDVGKLT